MSEFRKALCDAAGIEMDEWRFGGVPGIAKLKQKMIDEARKAKVGGCVLSFKSKTQAAWVKEEMEKLRIVPVWSRDDSDVSDDPELCCYWSEFAIAGVLPRISVQTDWQCLTADDIAARGKQAVARVKEILDQKP